jgi:hypothetical protein
VGRSGLNRDTQRTGRHVSSNPAALDSVSTDIYHRPAQSHRIAVHESPSELSKQVDTPVSRSLMVL